MKRGATVAEEILIDRHEDGIVHAEHPHVNTDIKMIDFPFCIDFFFMFLI